MKEKPDYGLVSVVLPVTFTEPQRPHKHTNNLISVHQCVRTLTCEQLWTKAGCTLTDLRLQDKHTSLHRNPHLSPLTMKDYYILYRIRGGSEASFYSGTITRCSSCLDHQPGPSPGPDAGVYRHGFNRADTEPFGKSLTEH